MHERLAQRSRRPCPVQHRRKRVGRDLNPEITDDALTRQPADQAGGDSEVTAGQVELGIGRLDRSDVVAQLRG